MKLREKVIQANRSAAQKQNELKEKELELNKLGKKLKGAETATAALKNSTLTAAPLSPDERKTAADLHRQIENLKAEISIQQHDRRQLRRQLQEAQKLLRMQEAPKTPAVSSDAQTVGLEPEATLKKILIPEFTPAFRRSCELLSVNLVAKALRAAADFAVHDKSIWRRTKPIETLSRVFRIQIGRQHRLLIGWEPEVRLEILDLIHRSNLETWIKRYAG
jgi:chromosome segregation ATPase